MPLWFKDTSAPTLFLCTLILLTLLWSGLAPMLNQLHYQSMRWQYQRQQSKLITHMNIAETEHFTYAYSELSDESLTLIQEESEHIFSAVNDFFGYTPQEKIPVMIYPTGEALNDRFGWEGDRSPMGVYWMGYINILAPECWIDGSTAARAQVFRHMGPMAHEYSHLIIDEQSRGNYPRWFSEGVAQYVEQSLGYFTTTMPPAAYRQFVPYQQLEKRFDDPALQTQAYWQSLETIHYLTQHYGDSIINQIIERLARCEDFETILKSLTGHSYQSLMNAATKLTNQPIAARMEAS